MVITDVNGVGVHVLLVEDVVCEVIGVVVVISGVIETGIIVGCCVVLVDVVIGV